VVHAAFHLCVFDLSGTPKYGVEGNGIYHPSVIPAFLPMQTSFRFPLSRRLFERLIHVPPVHDELSGTQQSKNKRNQNPMKPTAKTLAAAALAGLFAAGAAIAAPVHTNAEKDKCSGKDGCEGKKKEKSSLSITAE
jgi:hypothetical protein